MSNQNPVSQDSEAHEPKSGKSRRQPKSGNTQLFNELLSASNSLSVSEKLRLTKSLAGQLGFVLVGSGEILARGDTPKVKSSDRTKVKDPVRPNPLRGTQFELEKNQAYQALVDEKRLNGGAKLPQDNPAVLRYAAALAAYKAEYKRLQPVAPHGLATKSAKPSQKASKDRARKTSERSPEPRTSTTSKIIGIIREAVNPKKSKAGISDTQMEEDTL